MMSRRNRQRENLKKLALGSTLAAAAGYVAGVLTAPKSGKATRSDIKGLADKDVKKLHAELDQLVKDAKAASSKASTKSKKEISELVDKAKDAKEKAREVASAIHEGDAKDQDLAKALKQSKNALNNLRTYLKK